MPRPNEATYRSTGYSVMAGKGRLGSGERFRKLTAKLRGKGARDPKALAAWIGRKKYGAKKMNQMAARGRRRK